MLTANVFWENIEGRVGKKDFDTPLESFLQLGDLWNVCQKVALLMGLLDADAWLGAGVLDDEFAGWGWVADEVSSVA